MTAIPPRDDDVLLMDDPAILPWVLPPLGAALILTVLIDIFLTVLYARVGSGILSDRFACLMWWLCRAAVGNRNPWRTHAATVFGPVLLVTLVIGWMLGLVVGSAMIIQPAIGSHIRTNGTHTSTSFATAMYIAGDSMTTVGTSDYAPHTSFYKLFYLFDSFLGISILTLAVTYLLEIYNALQRRNTLATKIHLLTGETGDAALLIAGLAPDGRFETSYTQLTELAAEVISARESHHFYPALFYFKFREPHYALPRVALVVLDTVTLLKSALDDDRYQWLKRASVLDLLWKSSMHLLATLAWAFLPEGLPQGGEQIDPQTLESWRQRYQAAVQRFHECDIQTVDEQSGGFETYVALRARWDRYIHAFARHLADDMQTIDRAACDPDYNRQPREAPQRLRSIG